VSPTREAKEGASELADAFHHQHHKEGDEMSPLETRVKGYIILTVVMIVLATWIGVLA
jgi:hypothetical protein